MREYYTAQHLELHNQSEIILSQCAGHICSLEDAACLWARLAAEEKELATEVNDVGERLTQLENGCSSETYLTYLEEVQHLQRMLESAERRRGSIKEQVVTLSKIVASPALASIHDSSLDYHLPGLTIRLIQLRLLLEEFQDLWQEYEERQGTLQPWLALAEEQLETETGGLELLQAEIEAYNRLREAANTGFYSAMDKLPELEDEDMQRRLHLQFEERWNRLAVTLIEQKQRMEEDEREKVTSPAVVLEGIQSLLDQVEGQGEISFSQEQSAEQLLADLHKLTFLRNMVTMKQKSMMELKTSNVVEMEKLGAARSQLKSTLERTEKKIEEGNKTLEKCHQIRKMITKTKIKVDQLSTNLKRTKADPVSGSQSAKMKVRILQVC